MTNDVTTTATESPETARDYPVFRPMADIAETGDGISLMLEMPGVAPDAVDISLENRVLTIRGHARMTRPENLQLVYAEYREGDYERVFTLSEDFDPDRIEAQMRAGVLTLTLPRAAAAKPRKIEVKAA